MSEESDFIPYEVAMQIVGNVVEEEHLRELNKRVLTVYDKEGVELCWYNADEILAEATPEKPKDPESVKRACVEVVMRQIPKWALHDLLKRKKGEGHCESPSCECGCGDGD
ncbi:MAG: hypothetical protein PF442_04995 [Desulfobulbaceae bacterium]|jgi:hypothetical protein|nr:hypothetical protein [Desulfobulbaceae bacterium]